MASDKATRVKAWIGKSGRLKAWIIGLGAVAGALTAVLALLFMLVPGLKPSELPSEARATINKEELRAEPNVTLREFVQQPGIPTEAIEYANNLSEEELERVGSVVY